MVPRHASAVALLVARLCAAEPAEPAVAQFSAAADTGSWTPHQRRGELLLERREVAGSRFHEYRAQVDLPVDPDLAADDVWRSMRDGDMDSLKLRRILQQSPHRIVIYDQIRTPVVSDRDYTITVERVVDPTGRRTQIRCRTQNHLGPPPEAGLVRIPMIRAGWQVEPDGRDGTRLTYYSYSEPGGLITALLARGAQATRAFADVERMVLRLRRLGTVGGRDGGASDRAHGR